MNGAGEAAKAIDLTGDVSFNFEETFRAQYGRIARLIASVVRDPARAEELAVEVFLKLWRSPQAQGPKADAWLYKVAVRKGLDELRRRTRRARYEALFGFGQGVATPEDIRKVSETQEQVRFVLAVVSRRKAELLVLHSHGFGYVELASTLGLNPASVGTLLSRAQHAFRKEYIKRYGDK